MENATSDLCIKVPREKAEVLRRALQRLGILDHSRNITPSGVSVLIPVIRNPSPDEMKMLGEISPLEILHSDLPSPRKRPKDLMSSLDSTLPPYLLALLPRSFDIVGDIAVIEDLAPELVPHGEVLAKAIMEVHPRIRTVLLKTGKVEGDFRIPRLIVLAGEEKYETIHKEYGAKLKVDLSKAYFSPRLATEHHRVASMVHDGEVVVDMFTGVGPFSILIAKRASARVFSIDINPHAIALLKENIKLNRLKGEIVPICGDVRAIAPQLNGVADRVIMNLPSSSLDYLDVAISLLKKSGGMIHIYLFAKEDPIQSAKEMFNNRLTGLIKGCEVMNVRVVKPVAPREWQVVIDAWLRP
ncbi:MAG: class I SAM-dependent methyltransferase family protein [Candidatus Methanomethyliales bacterium]|nr:class I SAM-dependent methyltransferase family protein [Candidatus Methanomethylicales archaeon]